MSRDKFPNCKKSMDSLNTLNSVGLYHGLIGQSGQCSGTLWTVMTVFTIPNERIIVKYIIRTVFKVKHTLNPQ